MSQGTTGSYSSDRQDKWMSLPATGQGVKCVCREGEWKSYGIVEVNVKVDSSNDWLVTIS